MREIVTLKTSIDTEAASVRPDWETELRANLEPLGPIAIERSPHNLRFFTFIFDHYPEKLKEVRNHLEVCSIRVSIYVRREYTREELLNARFLEFGTETVVHSVDKTLQWHNNPLCSYCGFQDSVWDMPSLRIKEKPQGFQIATVDWHPVVVSASLAQVIGRGNLTGLELSPILGEDPPVWYALQSKHTLPPLTEQYTRLTRGSKATLLCEREHDWRHPDSELYYNRASFEGYDFNQTYEFFGDSGIASRALIISNRAYHLLLKHDVKQLAMEPIRFVE
jgi:hypothetical protein